jgi:hypothetical protein
VDDCFLRVCGIAFVEHGRGNCTVVVLRICCLGVGVIKRETSS